MRIEGRADQVELKPLVVGCNRRGP